MQNYNQEYFEKFEEFKKTANVLLEGFYDFKKQVQSNNKIDLSRQFSLINLPSEGKYYLDKKKSLLVRYLTATEEHVLCDSMLMESGRGIELVLQNLIIDDIDVKNLLLGDFQALLIFLRSTAYGDNVNFNIKCPHCEKESEHAFQLSSFSFKKPKNEPNEDGKYRIGLQLAEIELDIVISPLTLRSEMQKFENETDQDYFEFKDDEGNVNRIRKDKTLSLIYNIESINEITDKQKIKKIIRSIPKKGFDAISDFINENQSGIDENVNFVCPFCAEEFSQNIAVGYNFLSLPSSHKENIFEEMFLITYYGKGITRADALSMPILERKWHIRRIKEEVDKRNEEEKRAVSKGKK